MQIRFVEVQHFRGIRKMEWMVGGPMVCLVGPGDATKSTILDAIELALSPRTNVQVLDSDFYQEDIRTPIVTTVTVGQLPEEFLSDAKFGLLLRGWNEKTGLHDEPEADDEEVLSVRFQVDESLEPTWLVWSQRNPEGKPIYGTDRERFGAVRLGGEVDRHLSWARGSALSRITEGQTSAASILAEANRKAREMVFRAEAEALKRAAKETQRAAEQFGVKPSAEYEPAIDTRATVGGTGALSIYEGNVPVRMRGLGTRRLVTLALQSLSVRNGAIVLIDEVEAGLEPHRIRNLLVKLRKAAEADQNSKELAVGQVIMTTHSPSVIRTLSVRDLRVVRSTNGQTDVMALSSELQSTVRKAPEALLGRKVLICEGRTEEGLCWAMERMWARSHENLPLAHTGTVVVEGGGTKAPEVAVQLATLGYMVALFVDADVPLEPDLETLKFRGINVFQWEDGFSTEQRIAKDLPWGHFKRMVALAMEFKTPESIRDAVFAQLGSTPKAIGFDPDEWVKAGYKEDQLRSSFGKAAPKETHKWFKSIELGEKLGQIVAEALPEISETDLAVKLNQLGKWAYE